MWAHRPRYTNLHQLNARASPNKQIKDGRIHIQGLKHFKPRHLFDKPTWRIGIFAEWTTRMGIQHTLSRIPTHPTFEGVSGYAKHSFANPDCRQLPSIDFTVDNGSTHMKIRRYLFDRQDVWEGAKAFVNRRGALCSFRLVTGAARAAMRPWRMSLLDHDRSLRSPVPALRQIAENGPSRCTKSFVVVKK